MKKIAHKYFNKVLDDKEVICYVSSHDDKYTKQETVSSKSMI